MTTKSDVPTRETCDCGACAVCQSMRTGPELVADLARRRATSAMNEERHDAGAAGSEEQGREGATADEAHDGAAQPSRGSAGPGERSAQTQVQGLAVDRPSDAPAWPDGTPYDVWLLVSDHSIYAYRTEAGAKAGAHPNFFAVGPYNPGPVTDYAPAPEEGINPLSVSCPACCRAEGFSCRFAATIARGEATEGHFHAKRWVKARAAQKRGAPGTSDAPAPWVDESEGLLSLAGKPSDAIPQPGDFSPSSSPNRMREERDHYRAKYLELTAERRADYAPVRDAVRAVSREASTVMRRPDDGLGRLMSAIERLNVVLPKRGA